MSAFLAILCFAIAFLMHIFGWKSGKIDFITFELAGLFFLALAGVWSFTPWRRG